MRSHSPRGGCGLKLNCALVAGQPQSLSARRVWIEILLVLEELERIVCHSPRGGCGLKYGYCLIRLLVTEVTLREEGVD